MDSQTAAPSDRPRSARAGAWLCREAGRIRYRLLAVNLLVVLVPVAGLEFARVYERQLLNGLERDMRNQSVLVRTQLEADLRRGVPLHAPQHVELLTRAAERTRTRIRLLDSQRQLVADSHAGGPPEGPEPRAPTLLPRKVGFIDSTPRPLSTQRASWREVSERREVSDALAGKASAITRVAHRPHAVFFFLTEPVMAQGKVVGVVYATRSTQPVLVELYRIRTALVWLLFATLAFTALTTLALAWTISRPLARLSRAAKRIAAGERKVELPVGGGGEIRELSASFSVMTERLEQRLRYISDFAADVAHEFKSPLTSIRGAAELLREGAADDPAARERFLTNIELDAARLDRLVSRLLELSRIEASTESPREVDLKQLLARVVERYQTPDVLIALDVEGDLTTLRARAEDLETAVGNLVDNALRFSPSGGTVGVSLRREAGGLRIDVRDEGPGIAEEVRPRIFDRFFTTDESRDGTGLGLSIVKSVADAHGGRVVATNHPAGGAVLTLWLPLGTPNTLAGQTSKIPVIT